MAAQRFTTIGSAPECDMRLSGHHIEPLHACIIAGPNAMAPAKNRSARDYRVVRLPRAREIATRSEPYE